MELGLTAGHFATIAGGQGADQEERIEKSRGLRSLSKKDCVSASPLLALLRPTTMSAFVLLLRDKRTSEIISTRPS